MNQNQEEAKAIRQDLINKAKQLGYGGSLQVSTLELQAFVAVRDTPPDMKGVQRTNEAQVAVLPDPEGGRVVGFGVIDNLGKGAAGQAVQNLNLMADRPETEGLR